MLAAWRHDRSDSHIRMFSLSKRTLFKVMRTCILSPTPTSPHYFFLIPRAFVVKRSTAVVLLLLIGRFCLADIHIDSCYEPFLGVVCGLLAYFLVRGFF